MCEYAPSLFRCRSSWLRSTWLLVSQTGESTVTSAAEQLAILQETSEFWNHHCTSSVCSRFTLRDDAEWSRLLETMMTITGWYHLWTWCYRCLSHRCLLPPTFASRYRRGSLMHIYSAVCVLTLQCSSTHVNSSTKDELEGLKMFVLIEGLVTEGLWSMKSYLSLVLLWLL